MTPRRLLPSLCVLFIATLLTGCHTSNSATGEQMVEQEQRMAEEMMQEPTSFTVRIENVSGPGTIDSERAMGAVPLSPGVWAVHSGATPFFTPGESASAGLELLAEDGFPMMLARAMEGKERMMEDQQKMDDERMADEPSPMDDGGEMMEPSVVAASGVFARPVGKDANAPLTPGDAYEFTIQAQPGQRLSFVTMFVQSNDLFYAPKPAGLPLFEGGQAMAGSTTSQIHLWDAGTEQDTAPGTGADQKPAQEMEARDVGAGEDSVVRLARRTDGGFNYPNIGQVISVTVTPQ